MNLEEKIERSKSREKIDYSKIGCLKQKDTLVKLASSGNIRVEPIWTVKGDLEGSMYSEYMAMHPEYDGVYVRSELFNRLVKAADLLEEQFTLIIRAGHRPIEVQKKVLHGCMQKYKNANPTASDEEALEHARTFVSDPEVELPPHCCGAAVDLDMYDNDQDRLVDFGSKVNEDSEISYLHNSQISSLQRQNRLMLLKAMLDAGFASTYSEWWHYSYGDQVWAWFYGKNDCLYGLTER